MSVELKELLTFYCFLLNHLSDELLKKRDKSEIAIHFIIFTEMVIWVHMNPRRNVESCVEGKTANIEKKIYI